MRFLLSALTIALAAQAQAADVKTALTPAISAVMPQVISWRRDLHQHPELSNREKRTSAMVAAELKNSGWKCRPVLPIPAWSHC